MLNIITNGRVTSTTSSLQSARAAVALGKRRGYDVMVTDEATGAVVDMSDVAPAPGAAPVDPFRVYTLRTSKWA